MRAAASAEPAGSLHEVVAFLVGKRAFVVAREQVLGIRESPRITGARGGKAASPLPLVSFSAILGLDRDTSVDRRVLEVEHWGVRLGLEVTAIVGIRMLGESSLAPLPPIVRRTCGSDAVLGLVAADGLQAVALDLRRLLVERGIDVPAPG